MTLNESNNLYNYLHNFYQQNQISQFCGVSRDCLYRFLKNGNSKNKDKINLRMQIMKNLILKNANKGGF